MAAADALTVAETDLQRIKQRGCGTTLNDRAIMQLPDLTALAYPQPTNVPVEIDTGANNKYMGRSSVNAEGFVPPFVNTTLQQKESPTPASLINGEVGAGNDGTPGLDFAGTGDISQLNEVTFGNPPVLYKQIADSIRGEAVPAQAMPKILEDPLTPLGRAAIVSPDYARMGRQLEQRLYGAPVSRADAQLAPFSARCAAALKGVMYDILHMDSFRRQREEAGLSCDVGALGWELTTRDGRGPHLLFTLILVGLIGLVVWTTFAPHRTVRFPAAAYGYAPPPWGTYRTGWTA